MKDSALPPGDNSWQIFIDTGGTFTDCIAQSPKGEQKRLKVLSNSTLLGTTKAGSTSNTLMPHWPYRFPLGLLTGYTVRFFELNTTAKVVGYVQNDALLLDRQLPIKEGMPFEVTANEEVPILAARLLTETPLDEPLPFLTMRLGTTKGTNALLERKGAQVLFVTTQGHKDLVAIGTQQRQNIFDLAPASPPTMYTKVLEADERLGADGTTHIPLTASTLKKIVNTAQEIGAEAIAVAFMHSYLNSEHEQRVKEALSQAGYSYVSCSAALSPSIKILPRAQTAIVNAYLSPIVGQYIQNIYNKLSGNALKIMTSAGGLVDGHYFHPKDSLLSGPSGGVVGAAHQAKLAGWKKILTLDMGGTSTDVAHYNNGFDYAYEQAVGDATIASPSLAITTIAAGGGSICGFDGHKLTVGPESAGADPGPACYGKGGPLTLTDVNLLTGHLDPRRFGIPVFPKASAVALEALIAQLADASGKYYTPQELLTAFLGIANEKMAEAMKKISVAKGYDPAEYALLAFGGAGGQHCCQVAALIGAQHAIVPYDAGLLSAVGIGIADVERFAQKQVLQPLHNLSDNLDELVESTKVLAKAKLQNEGFNQAAIYYKATTLHLRFVGQDTTLPIDYAPDLNIAESFKTQYQQLYGHWVADKAIEVESIKVIAAISNPKAPTNPTTLTSYTPTPNHTIERTLTAQPPIPSYDWESLKPGARIDGPSVVASGTSTTVIAQGWQASVLHNLDMVFKKVTNEQQTHVPEQTQTPEEAALELFTNRFKAVADEMGALLQRTAFSVNVKERLDFSCAMLDMYGELIVNAPHIPVHLGSMGICVRSVKTHMEMEVGDVIVTNHPAFGGSHLPDVTLICPVYYQEQLVGYLANRAHHAEIGGKSPGSMPADATCLEEEGVVIRPTYLVKKGVPQWDAITKILTSAPYPTRALAENLADLNASLASIYAGQKALTNLCSQYGYEPTIQYMAMLKSYAHQRLKQRCLEIGEGIFKATEHLDDGAPLTVTIVIKEGKLNISFDGSSGQHQGNFNATTAITYSVILYVLRLLVKEDIPLNEGLLANVQVEVPTGLLNPNFGDNDQLNPAVVGGNTEVSQRLTDTLLKALGLAACSQGTMNNLLFGNEQFGYYETICGGVGATHGHAGAHGTHQHMTNTRITDPEILEYRYPVELTKFALRKGSGGKGKWPGGDGIIRSIKFLAPVSLTLLMQHRKEAPYGLDNGQPGLKGEQFITKVGDTAKPVSGIYQTMMQPGDVVTVHTPGGGGYGALNDK